MKISNFLIPLLILSFISCRSDKLTDLPTEISIIENGLLPSILVRGDSIKQYHLLDRMDHYHVPGVSIAVVDNGEIKWAKGYGVANTTDELEVQTNTLFQAGSISKPLAALSVLKLMEEGKIEIDEDVNTYLKNWKIPENEFTRDEKVTLRRLLTHTAGMTVHGFPGYQQRDSFPSIETVLNGKGNTPAIFADTIPGSIWRYSGGGYTVMEKLVEDISGLPFEEYMAENILFPIGMENSTYEQPLPSNLHATASAAYDNKGDVIEGLWHNYPEQAAAGLWTTPTDLAKYCIEIQDVSAGKAHGILTEETVRMMLTKHKNDWGLGLSLTWDADSLRFQHGGKNAGFTNDMKAFAYRGKAIIIMTNADNGGKLIGEILRSVSNYYDWGISKPRIVETIELPLDQLNKFVGHYKLDFQVPGIGDYLIEIQLKHKHLFVIDPNNKDTNVLTALDDLNFIDLEKGDEVKFQAQEDSVLIGLLWNGTYQFNKIDD
jgi:CubicO group peptidase (beta-lactamase class C family)